MLKLQAVTGSDQIIAGTAFQPLTVRVTDSSTPPNPVLAASVLFQDTVLRPAANDLTLAPGDSAAMPVILSSTQVSMPSNGNGLASFIPSVGSFSGTLEIEIQVSAGATAALQDVLEIFPESVSGDTSPGASGPWHGNVPDPRGSPPRTPRADEY